MSSADEHLGVPMRAVPGGPWGRTWVVTAVLLVASCIALELFVRARGYRPSVNEDVQSWALERRRASDRSPRTVAILGASRILLAFSPGTFRDRLPGHRYVQLAYQGSAPLGSLRDLALDPDFRGIALVDVTESQFWPSNWYVQDHLLAAFHRGWRGAGQLVERWLTTQVQSRVALLAADGLRVADGLLRDGAWPPPPYTRTFADRTKFADYDLVDVERKRRIRVSRVDPNVAPADADQWLAHALSHELFVTLIRARGGHVVYVRMPTCDERWQADEARHPKAHTWDRFAAVSQATTIHFKDHATLADFACPDTSHIDSKDGPRFTGALLDILLARGVIQR